MCGPWTQLHFFHPCLRTVNTASVNRAPVNMWTRAMLRKSIIVQCFFSTRPLNMGSVNSAPVFTACVGDISTNQKIHLITAALRIMWTRRHHECLLSKYYFLFVYFALLYVRFIVKRLLTRLSLWKSHLFQAFSIDILCTGILLVSIGNDRVFLVLYMP